jgi:hypothetical protein
MPSDTDASLGVVGASRERKFQAGTFDASCIVRVDHIYNGRSGNRVPHHRMRLTERQEKIPAWNFCRY